MAGWSNVELATLDPIHATVLRFLADTDERKIMACVGAYRTDEGEPLVLNCVKKAERRILEDASLNKEYGPPVGDADFLKLCQKVLFGENSKLLKNCSQEDGLVATVQTISGSGSLTVGAEFVKRFAKGTTVYISTPSWSQHNSIMDRAGVSYKAYRYWNAAGRNLDLEGMLADIQGAPDRSIILLHTAAHNPTGLDPTKEQWDKIMAVCQSKKHLCWFDSAYQGFATGDLETDAYAMRKFAEAGLPLLVSQSFSKNMGLYGERVGTFSTTCSSPDAVQKVISQLATIIRDLYSTPPKHGANIVNTVLSDPVLYQEWREELLAMSKRIQDMRKMLHDELTRLGTPGSWSHITSQIGMFSFTGLNPQQSKAMVEKHHIYMLGNGRFSITGVTPGNVKYIAQAIDDVVRNPQSAL